MDFASTFILAQKCPARIGMFSASTVQPIKVLTVNIIFKNQHFFQTVNSHNSRIIWARELLYGNVFFLVRSTSVSIFKKIKNCKLFSKKIEWSDIEWPIEEYSDHICECKCFYRLIYCSHGPMATGIEISASVKNLQAGKYIAPTGIEIIWGSA